MNLELGLEDKASKLCHAIARDMRMAPSSVAIRRPAFSFGLCGARAADAFQISNPEGGEVRAVIIGIDDYQHVRKLKGAAADARDIGSTLKNMGVRDIIMLLNEQVDRSAVLREISALV